MSMATAQPVEVRRPVTDLELEIFRTQLAVMFEQHRAQHFPRLDAEKVVMRKGRKYARYYHGTTIYCFVELKTGDILMPESLKKAAKHPRGNIHNQNPLACCGPYGVAYMK